MAPQGLCAKVTTCMYSYIHAQFLNTCTCVINISSGDANTTATNLHTHTGTCRLPANPSEEQSVSPQPYNHTYVCGSMSKERGGRRGGELPLLLHLSSVEGLGLGEELLSCTSTQEERSAWPLSPSQSSPWYAQLVIIPQELTITFKYLISYTSLHMTISMRPAHVYNLASCSLGIFTYRKYAVLSKGRKFLIIVSRPFEAASSMDGGVGIK